MKDDSKKNIQRMEDTDLGAVNGGLSVFSRQSPNTGRYTPEDRMILSDVITEKTAAGTGSLTDKNGLGTVTAFCPSCGNMTKHIVFNGGRGKCTVCGHAQQKL